MGGVLLRSSSIMVATSGTIAAAVWTCGFWLDGLAGKYAADRSPCNLGKYSLVDALTHLVVCWSLDCFSANANAGDFDAMSFRASIRWIACGLAIACCLRTHADGGAVVDRGRCGAYDATIFLAPVPPSAGAIDFSILLSRSGEPQLIVPVHVRAEGPNGAWTEGQMHDADSGNRLLRACSLTLGSSGPWRISIQVGENTADFRSFEISVNPAPPPWRASLPWMILWIPVALLLVAREILVAGQRRRRGAWDDSNHFSATILR